MANDQILKRFLSPADPSKEDFWAEFVHASATHLMLWHPSAKDNVNDLLLKPSGRKEGLIHTHTDYFPPPGFYKMVYGKHNPTISYSHAQFRLVDFAELEFQRAIREVNYDHLPQHLAATMASASDNREQLEKIRSKEEPGGNLEGLEGWLRGPTVDDIAERAKRPQFLLVNRGLLLKMHVDDGAAPGYQRYLLYLFIEDLIFMERFVVEEGMKLSHIWNGYYV